MGLFWALCIDHSVVIILSRSLSQTSRNLISFSFNYGQLKIKRGSMFKCYPAVTDLFLPIKATSITPRLNLPIEAFLVILWANGLMVDDINVSERSSGHF
jgi:hypothetical protein